MKRLLTTAICLLGMARICGFAQAGEMDPPGPPAPTMVTLQELSDEMKRPPDMCFDNTGNRFVDCGNGTVKDTETGLFWLKNAGCFLEDWATACIEVAQLADGQCGLTDGSRPGDWRLPTLWCPSGAASCTLDDAEGEFASIFASSCSPPHIPDTAGTGCWSEGDPFTGVNSDWYYRSATTYAADPTRSYTKINLSPAVGSYYKVNHYWVWPIRGGQ